MASAADVLSPGAERRVFWTAAAATVALDLITKIVAEATLLRTPGISVVGDWFQLRLVYNQGAAFGGGHHGAIGALDTGRGLGGDGGDYPAGPPSGCRRWRTHR